MVVLTTGVSKTNEDVSNHRKEIIKPILENDVHFPGRPFRQETLHYKVDIC